MQSVDGAQMVVEIMSGGDFYNMDNVNCGGGNDQNQHHHHHYYHRDHA